MMGLSTENNKKGGEQQRSPVALQKEAEEDKKGEVEGAANGAGRSGVLIPNGPSQFTIFYNGSVCVFDSITPGKAQAIMLVAAATAAANVGSPVLAGPQSSQSSTAAAGATPTQTQPPQSQPNLISRGNTLCKLQTELPLARRNSLQCFLEKRRDRLVNKSPYSINKPETPGRGSPAVEPSTPPRGCHDIVNSN